MNFYLDEATNNYEPAVVVVIEIFYTKQVHLHFWVSILTKTLNITLILTLFEQQLYLGIFLIRIYIVN